MISAWDIDKGFRPGFPWGHSCHSSLRHLYSNITWRTQPLIASLSFIIILPNPIWVCVWTIKFTVRPHILKKELDMMELNAWGCCRLVLCTVTWMLTCFHLNLAAIIIYDIISSASVIWWIYNIVTSISSILSPRGTGMEKLYHVYRPYRLV